MASLLLSSKINLLGLGDGIAASLGVRVKLLRIICIICACASAASVVSFAGLLGFDAPTANSLDGVADRDFVLELLSALSILMVHLSRFAEEIDILVISPDLVSFLQCVRIYGSVDFVVPPFALSDYCRFSIPGEHIYFDLFSCPGASSPPASDLIIYEGTVLHGIQ